MYVIKKCIELNMHAPTISIELNSCCIAQHNNNALFLQNKHLLLCINLEMLEAESIKRVENQLESCIITL